MRKHFTLALMMFLGSAVMLYSQSSEVRDTLSASLKVDSRKMARDIGEISADVAAIRGVVSPLGEGDAIKWAQSLPGVTTGADGSSAFYVRGGNMGNNLITLDGVPVYGYSHLLGLTTIIPSETMRDATLLKGGFDGGEGNFTSSHLKIVTRSPKDSMAMSASLNNFMASYSIESSINERMSFMASARVSPLALEYRALRGLLPSLLGGFENFGAEVGDVYGKFHWQMDARRSLSTSFLGSMDRYSFIAPGGGHERMGWDNEIAMVKYISYGDECQTELTGSVNHYSNRQIQGKYYRDIWQELSLESELLESTLSADRTRQYTDRFGMTYGGKLRHALFMPGQVAAEKNRTHTLLMTAYLQGEYTIPDHLFLRTSLRGHYYHNFLAGKSYVGPDASLYIKWNLGRHLAFEGTFDRMVQYYHTLEGLPVGWSLDMLVPSGRIAAPETSLQGNAGLSWSHGSHSVSFGGFMKHMDNLVYYRYAQSLFNGALAAWEDNVDLGKGRSYGAEFMYEYVGDELYGKLSYTLSKTDRYDFPSVCDGDVFHARFDRRHVLNMSAQWRGFKAALNAMSGHWENGAAETYLLPHLMNEVIITDYYGGKVNNFHMPTVFRLDLGYEFSFTTGRVKHDVNLGVCNVTNHFNPFMLYYDARSETYKMIALLPILPNFSYRISF